MPRQYVSAQWRGVIRPPSLWLRDEEVALFPAEFGPSMKISYLVAGRRETRTAWELVLSEWAVS